MALIHRAPPAEMRLHSDQGSPYTATNALARVAEKGIVVSMSRAGEWYDNAAMERFFSTRKGECVDRHRFQSRNEEYQGVEVRVSYGDAS